MKTSQLNATGMKEYRKCRAKGEPAKYALRSVRTMIQWDKLYYGDDDDRTYVRLRLVPDECATLADLEGDSYNPKVNEDISPAKLKKERKEFIDRINRDGVWGIVGEYRINSNEEWVIADSCFGFVGDDWKDSGYDIDIMSTTLEARTEAMGDVCAHCGRPRKANAK